MSDISAPPDANPLGSLQHVGGRIGQGWAMARRCQNTHAFATADVVILAVVMLVATAAILPTFDQPSPEAKWSETTAALQHVRAQIQRYRLDHEGRTPDLASFSEQLTLYTDLGGACSPVPTSRYSHGPYLTRIPRNPWRGANDVAGPATDSAAWHYDQGNGRFTANLPFDSPTP